MKKLYEFTIEKEEEVVQEEVVHEEDGSTTTKSKKVNKKVPYEFFIKKPTHSMIDDASLYYGVELAKSVKAGMLTESMLRKRFEEDGGILSKKEIKDYEQLYEELRSVVEQVAKIESSKKQTKADKTKLKKLEQEKNDLLNSIQTFETQRSSLFNQTAESRARNKVIVWWVVNLSYGLDEDDNPSLIWGGEEEEERINNYHEWYEDANTIFDTEKRLKFLYYISFWFNSTSSDPESFTHIAARADEEIKRELEETFPSGEKD